MGLKIRLKLAWIGYLLVAFLYAANGFGYLFAKQIMPYHLAAMGKSWAHLSAGTQVMTLDFMKSAAAGFLTTSIAMFLLLLIPFRKGELWARWAVFAIALNETLIILFRTLHIMAHTPARPPVIFTVYMLILIGVSCILAFEIKFEKRSRNDQKG